MMSALQAFAENLNEFSLSETLGVTEPGESKLLQHISHNTPFEFEIQNSNKEVLGIIQEEKKEGLVPFFIKNSWLRGRRAMKLKVSNENHETIMYLDKDDHVFASNTLIYNEEKEPIGSIKRRFNPLVRKYDFLTTNKQRLAFIYSPIIQIWSFPIYNLRNKKIGMIKKGLPSVGQFLTRREKVKVQLKGMSPEQKIMGLVASIVLSLEYFNAN